MGDLLAPTLFSLYFAIVLLDAFGDCHGGIIVRYRSTGKLFKFTAKIKVFFSLVRNLLYADDFDLVAHTIQHTQEFIDRLTGSM